MRDIRLYYYDSGSLIKNQGGYKEHHNFTSPDECAAYVWKRKENQLKRKIDIQYVVVEYFDNYKSKIIEVI